MSLFVEILVVCGEYMNEGYEVRSSWHHQLVCSGFGPRYFLKSPATGIEALKKAFPMSPTQMVQQDTIPSILGPFLPCTSKRQVVYEAVPIWIG
jgi:hypothetical protein